MIAAAALATLAVPSVAQAAKFSDRIHLLQDLKNAKKDQLTQLKVDWKTGNSTLTRAEYRAKLAKIQAAIDRLAGKVDRLRDRQASA